MSSAITLRWWSDCSTFLSAHFPVADNRYHIPSYVLVSWLMIDKRLLIGSEQYARALKLRVPAEQNQFYSVVHMHYTAWYFCSSRFVAYYWHLAADIVSWSRQSHVVCRINISVELLQWKSSQQTVQCPGAAASLSWGYLPFESQIAAPHIWFHQDTGGSIGHRGQASVSRAPLEIFGQTALWTTTTIPWHSPSLLILRIVCTLNGGNSNTTYCGDISSTI